MSTLSRRTFARIAAGATAAIGLPNRLWGAATAADPFRWGIDYGAATDPAAARAYRLLVLEPDHDRAIAPLRAPGGRLLGYLSLGEIARSRPAYPRVAEAGALLNANPDWPDARMADLRHPAWRACVIDEMAPQILARGYDGLFLDTLDNAEAIERRDPVGAAGMVEAAASLVMALRKAAPRAFLMMNRGYALLQTAAPSIDAVLGEAMATRWNFAAQSYDRLSASDWQWQADRLRAAKRANPRLALMTLDYWSPEDRATCAALYARQRAAGFNPYVATLALDRLVPEPRA